MIRLGLDEYRPPNRQKRELTYSQFDGLGLLEPPNTSGVSVTEKSALSCSAFWNGVAIISSQIATLPRVVYKRLDRDERERDRTQPAAKVLSKPNPNMTDVVFWETLIAHVLTWGNAYAEIEFDRSNRPIALWPVTPDAMDPVIDGGRLRYRYRGGRDLLESEDVFHVPGLGFDGLKGYSVVHMARESLALGLAAERFGGSFFGNGAWPGLVLEHPGTLGDEAYNRLKASNDAAHGGPGRAHRTKILEEGMKAQKIGIPPEDAQFLETRQFQVEEIARWLNINPAKLKLKVGERPGGNLETSQIEFLTDTLRPWLVRIEQEANRKLFPAAQQSTYYVEHNVEAILRVDNAARMAGYRALFDMKVINAEQIARKENLPKPENMEPTLPAPAPPPLEPNARMASAQRALVVDVVSQFVRREAEKVRRATKRGAAGLDTWLDEFYASEAPVLRSYLMGPVRVALAAAGVDADPGHVAGEVADWYVQRSREQLMDLPSRNLEDAAERLMAGWESSRPIDVAERMQSLDLESYRRTS